MEKYITGAALLRQLVRMEHELAEIEGTTFNYRYGGSFTGISANERILNMFERVSVLEGTPPPDELPEGWIQGRTPVARLQDLSDRIDALKEGPPIIESPPLVVTVNESLRFVEDRLYALVTEQPPVELALVMTVGETVRAGESNLYSLVTEEPTYPLTIFEQVLDEEPDTANNWSTRSIVQVSSGSGPQGQVRVVFEAAPNRDFRINNASIGISIMVDVNDVPDNGATMGIPKELFPLGGYKRNSAGQHWYVMRGSKAVTEWLDFPTFTEDQLLVVIIDHNSDTGNPTGKSGLGSFPAAGAVRQAYQASTKSYNSNQGIGEATDGVLWAVTQIEVR